MIFPCRGVLAGADEEIFGIRRYGACVRAALGGRGFDLRGVFRLRRKNRRITAAGATKKTGACVRTAAFSSPRKGVFGAENAFAHTPLSPYGNSPRGNFFAKYKHLFDFFLSARYTMNKCLKMRGNAR